MTEGSDNQRFPDFTRSGFFDDILGNIKSFSQTLFLKSLLAAAASWWGWGEGWPGNKILWEGGKQGS